MTSILGVRANVREKTIMGSSSLMIGPRELATVIGKLEALDMEAGRKADESRARINSSVVLLDREALEFRTLTLVAQRPGKESEVSIFSPLGCALLGCRPGDTLTLPGYGSGYRFIVSSVRQAA